MRKPGARTARGEEPLSRRGVLGGLAALPVVLSGVGSAAPALAATATRPGSVLDGRRRPGARGGAAVQRPAAQGTPPPTGLVFDLSEPPAPAQLKLRAEPWRIGSVPQGCGTVFAWSCR